MSTLATTGNGMQTKLLWAAIVALGAHLLHEGEPVRLMESERAQSLAVNGARPR